MTAEISILNRCAVALAADSAVTHQQGNYVKVRPTANKIFSLSKYNPVGVMIYDQAMLAGVPWETIVKAFREDLGRRTLPTIEAYSQAFFAFIERSGIVGRDFQDEWYVVSVYSYFEMLRTTLVQRIQERERQGRSITRDGAARLFSSVVKEHYESWQGADFLDPENGEASQREVRERFRERIEQSMTEIFENLPIARRTLDRLVRIACLLPLKWPTWPRPPQSGVVLAGFGSHATFPSMRAFCVSGMLHDRLKLTGDPDGKIDIGIATGAAIVPFAQRSWVDVFLTGLHPLHQVTFRQLVSELAVGVATAVIDRIPRLSETTKTREKNRMNVAVVNELVRETLETFHRHTIRKFSQPVLETLTGLSKEELAEIAEALVGLTSFRQQVTMETETVGGPIDVALISKGDGFIWVRRKHYFDRELNPHFFATYYEEARSGCDGTKEEA